MNIQELRERANQISRKLLASDSRFNSSVTITHEDGSFLHFENAFAATHTVKLKPEEIPRWAVSDEESWIIVFTEHHGTYVFSDDSVRVTHRGCKVSPIPLSAFDK
jgi:hypothetical protein